MDFSSSDTESLPPCRLDDTECNICLLKNLTVDEFVEAIAAFITNAIGERMRSFEDALVKWGTSLFERARMSREAMVYGCLLLMRICSVVQHTATPKNIQTYCIVCIMTAYSMLYDIAYSLKAWSTISGEVYSVDQLKETQATFLKLVGWNLFATDEDFQRISGLIYDFYIMARAPKAKQIPVLAGSGKHSKI